MPYDTPDMGLSQILQMAQIAQPQMQPNAPLGAPSAMVGYDRDKQRQDQMLQQAQGLAALMAKMKQGAAGEYEQGAPGRSDEINLQNILSRGKLGNADSLLSTQRDTATAGANEATTKRIQTETAQLSEYANMHSQPGVSLDDIRAKMRADGKTRIGNKSLDEIPDDKLSGLLQNIRGQSINTPKQAGSEQLEAAKGDWHVKMAEIRAKSLIKAKEIESEMRGSIAKMAETNRPPDPTRVIYQRIEKELGSVAAIQWYEQHLQEIAKLNASGKPQQLDFAPGGLGADSPIRPRPMPQPTPAMPPKGFQGVPPAGPAPAPMPAPTVTPPMPSGPASEQAQSGPPPPPPAPKGAIIRKFDEKLGKWVFKTEKGDIIDERGNKI